MSATICPQYSRRIHIQPAPARSPGGRSQWRQIWVQVQALPQDHNVPWSRWHLSFHPTTCRTKVGALSVIKYVMILSV